MVTASPNMSEQQFPMYLQVRRHF